MGYLWNHGWAMEMIIPTVLVVGALAGALNGVLVTRLGLPSLAVTIGTLGLYRGLAYVILGDQAVADFPSQFTDWGFGTFAGTQIPNPFVLFIVLAVVFGIVLHCTGIGRSIFAMGANEEAAHFSGVRVKRIKFWLFVVTGMVAALAGIVYTFRFASARADNARRPRAVRRRRRAARRRLDLRRPRAICSASSAPCCCSARCATR